MVAEGVSVRGGELCGPAKDAIGECGKEIEKCRIGGQGGDLGGRGESCGESADLIRRMNGSVGAMDEIDLGEIGGAGFGDSTEGALESGPDGVNVGVVAEGEFSGIGQVEGAGLEGGTFGRESGGVFEVHEFDSVLGGEFFEGNGLAFDDGLNGLAGDFASKEKGEQGCGPTPFEHVHLHCGAARQSLPNRIQRLDYTGFFRFGLGWRDCRFWDDLDMMCRRGAGCK